MRPVVIGTAGHIDHGKTTLVQAITGQNTDRLPEEKQRGISIDLGFAQMQLPSGRTAAFVDVPGHERFIRNMVAGVHGMDAVVLVVAADEGVMPQTREHLAILTLLGVQRGLTVLTKIDLVDPEWLELVIADTRDVLAETFLANQPIVPVSATNGQGLGELLQDLDRLADTLPPRDDTGLPRLPVDRVFTVRGFGTVVTGTLTSGRLALDDPITVLPEDIKSRVRGLQVHGQRVESVAAGQRVAVNLGGVERRAVHRGQVLATPGSIAPASVAAVALTLLPDAVALKHRSRVHTYVGTQEVLARVYFFDREKLEPAETTWAEIRWEEPVVIQRGDRVLLRSYSPVTTIGGGRIGQVGVHHQRKESGLLERLTVELESNPETLAIAVLQATDRPLLLNDLARQVGTSVEDLQSSLKARHDVEVWDGRWVFHRHLRDRLTQEIQEMLARYHARYPLRPGLTREALKALWGDWDSRLAARFLQSVPEVRVDGEWVSREAFAVTPTETDHQRARRILEELRVAQLKPPDISAVLETLGANDEQGRDLVQWLLAEGQLVKVDEDLYVAREAFDQAVDAVRAALKVHGQLGTSELREVLGTSRKYAVPLLERMDEARITRRLGDTRVLAGL